MKKSIMFSFIVSVFMLAGAVEAYACSCMVDMKPLKAQVKAAYNGSSAIFSGEVLEVTSQNEQMYTVRLKVIKSWKGGIAKEITVTTAKDSSMCGYDFETGKKYLIYANGDKSNLGVGICSRTTSLPNKTDLRHLDRLKKTKGKSA